MEQFLRVAFRVCVVTVGKTATWLILVPIQGTVLRTFRHQGLKRLFQQGDPSKIRGDQVGRVADVLAHLDRACRPSDLDLPGYRLHPLKGRSEGPLEHYDLNQLADRFSAAGR